ncbi:unnamed protein product [Umbelopsis sp. WA50703]
MSNLIELSSEEKFQQLIAGNVPVILNFWASWAEPCSQMNEVFKELANKFPTLKFIQIEAENFPEASEKFEIESVPTFVIVKNDKIVSKIEGAKAAELSNAVAKYAKGVLANNTSANGVAGASPPMRDLQSRLKALVNSAPVMIFIKGTPQQPRCGFSRQLVDLLAEQNVRYSSFNILADEDVRQGK